MNIAPLRHLPRKIKPEYTEAMCGAIITDNSAICHDPTRATCARCVDDHNSEAFREQDDFYNYG
ncbi:hypothetical protein [Embleya sp. NPDC001921]